MAEWVALCDSYATRLSRSEAECSHLRSLLADRRA